MTSQCPAVGVVLDFYAAIQKKDVDALTAILDTRFAEDVTVEIPPSLYYGGKYEGRDTLKKLFGGLAHPKSAIDASTFTVERIVGQDDLVSAELSFAWRGRGGGEPLMTGNTEWITFRDGKVSSIRAFYQDTAACRATDEASRSAHRSPS